MRMQAIGSRGTNGQMKPENILIRVIFCTKAELTVKLKYWNTNKKFFLNFLQSYFY